MKEFIFLGINVALFLFYLKILIALKKKDLRIVSTIHYFRYKVGHLISISGKLRVGKSTSSVGIAHILERIIIEKKMEVIETTKAILLNVDFNFLDQDILELFSEGHDIDETYLKINSENKIKGIYNNFLGNISISEQLYKYIEAMYYFYIDNNAIISSDKLYSHNSQKRAYKYESSLLKIAEAFEKEDFKMTKYKVILVDESNATRGSAFSNDKEIKRDSIKVSQQLLGNMYEQTVYYISIKQDAKDDIAQERRLFPTNLLFHGGEEKYPLLFIIRIYHLMLNSKLKFYSFIKTFYIIRRRKREEKIELIRNRNKNYIRRLEARKKISLDFIKSCGLKKMFVTNYAEANDVSKQNADAEDVIFYLPLDECYGVMDTYNYRKVYYYLKKLSKKSKLQVEYDKEKEARELLEELNERMVRD